MPHDADPPRKHYQLKPRQFEQVNEIRPPQEPPPPPGVTPASAPAPSEKIDVRDLARLASEGMPLLSANAPASRETEVHGMLRGNFAQDEAAGLFYVPPTVDKKRRARVRRFWIALILVDGACALLAWSFGPRNAVPFVSAIAGAGMFTTVLIWQTWFLRTD